VLKFSIESAYKDYKRNKKSTKDILSDFLAKWGIGNVNYERYSVLIDIMENKEKIINWDSFKIIAIKENGEGITH
jgi:hypothetical protein